MECYSSDEENKQIKAAKNKLWRWGKISDENDFKDYKENDTKISRAEFLEAESK